MPRVVHDRRAGLAWRPGFDALPLVSDDCFFSSRRRHTRSLCDWSSDVCSSDLVVVTAADVAGNVGSSAPVTLADRTKTSTRSEERRAGKERRSRGLTYQLIK